MLTSDIRNLFTSFVTLICHECHIPRENLNVIFKYTSYKLATNSTTWEKKSACYLNPRFFRSVEAKKEQFCGNCVYKICDRTSGDVKWFVQIIVCFTRKWMGHLISQNNLKVEKPKNKRNRVEN